MDRHRAGPDTTRPSRDDDQAPVDSHAHGRSKANSAEIMSVRLTRKYAEAIDGVDLSGADVGDRLSLSHRDAGMLIAEGWAEPAPVEHNRRATDIRAEAADKQPGRRS